MASWKSGSPRGGLWGRVEYQRADVGVLISEGYETGCWAAWVSRTERDGKVLIRKEGPKRPWRWMPGCGGQAASWSLSPEGGVPEGPPGWRTWGPSHQGSEVSLGWAPPPPYSMMEVGVPGRSLARQASLPREQEAEPRPADLLLEVRGQGRPSRPHFLQPRPTPCGPRVYGNSGLDGFSEIIRSLCPHLTPRAQRE